MTYTYTPHGVCSRQINFELDDDCKVSGKARVCKTLIPQFKSG